MQNDDLKDISVNDHGYICHQKNNCKCYSYTLFWYFINSIQGSLKFFGQFKVISQRFLETSTDLSPYEHSLLEGWLWLSQITQYTVQLSIMFMSENRYETHFHSSCSQID